MRRKNIYFLLLLLVVLTIGFVLALGYRPRARLFPLLVISACEILVLAELLKYLGLGSKKKGAPVAETQKDKDALEMEKQWRRRFFAILCWLGGFTFALWLLGFVIGLPLFVFAYVKTHEKGWLWPLVLTAAMFVIVFVGFGFLLETPLYEGRLFLR